MIARWQVVLSALVMLTGVAMPAWADAGAALDITMEVLGKNEHVDERLVNRIEIPGVGRDRVPVSAAQRSQDERERQERRQQNRDDYREARQQRREDARERQRERRQ